MNYEFPIIRTIADVLPAIDGRKEFIVAEREFGTVINYQVVMSDTFPPVKVAGGSAKMREQRSYQYRVRRECRGLIFDKQGNLISRPYHKFFNINEREETQLHELDFSKQHERLEKLDGSMVRPLVIDGEVRLATKMGLTDISDAATTLLNEEQKLWLHEAYNNGLTPILEYTSPDNRIVVNYVDSKLTITALRDNETGEYLSLDFASPFDHVVPLGEVKDKSTYLQELAKERNREGDVIRFADGHMVKGKNDWYLDLHKAKDEVQFDHKVAQKYFANTIDDVLGKLDANDVVRVQAISQTLSKGFSAAVARIEKLHNKVAHMSKKDFALNAAPTLNKTDVSIIFRVMDGHTVDGLVLDHCCKSVNSKNDYNNLLTWMYK